MAAATLCLGMLRARGLCVVVQDVLMQSSPPLGVDGHTVLLQLRGIGLRTPLPRFLIITGVQ
jgi:hypothetical protein